jgi:hypothetical protein
MEEKWFRPDGWGCWWGMKWGGLGVEVDITGVVVNITGIVVNITGVVVNITGVVVDIAGVLVGVAEVLVGVTEIVEDTIGVVVDSIGIVVMVVERQRTLRRSSKSRPRYFSRTTGLAASSSATPWKSTFPSKRR